MIIVWAERLNLSMERQPIAPEYFSIGRPHPLIHHDEVFSGSLISPAATRT